ncbi:MAG: N-acetyl-gamma-glutamyl-phosphate reductase [bacterium]
MNQLKAGIIGGAGYTGMELLRILARHPRARPVCITSRALAGQAVADAFPSLRGAIDLAFTAPDGEALAQCDVVFSATPNGVAMTQVEPLLRAGVKVIDLSADFRLNDAALWSKWYGAAHACPQLLAEAAYGLPEINRTRIRGARLVANPGCYPTAVLLGYLPLIENRLIDLDHLIADVKSGVSGAGRKASLTTALGEAGESFKAYAVPGHRHQPEIKQELDRIASACAPDSDSTADSSVAVSVGLVFTPHLLPIVRGIHATLYGRLLSDRADAVDLQTLYEQRFADEPFVDVLPAGAHPDTRGVRGANTCRIAVHRPQDGDTVVVLAVEDNLVKGAAGQAVQNMNLMFDLPETAGLDALAPVP